MEKYVSFSFQVIAKWVISTRECKTKISTNAYTWIEKLHDDQNLIYGQIGMEKLEWMKESSHRIKFIMPFSKIRGGGAQNS